MSEQGKMTDAEIVESYISDLHRKTVVSDCYTPTDGEVLEAWAAHNTPDLPTALDLVGAYDAFKSWLAEHDAKVRAESIREAAQTVHVEARWQAEQKMRGAVQRSGAETAVDRLLVIEKLFHEQADRIEKEAGLK